MRTGYFETLECARIENTIDTYLATERETTSVEGTLEGSGAVGTQVDSAFGNLTPDIVGNTHG